MKLLRRGNQNDEVAELHKELLKRKYFVTQPELDSKFFGEHTHISVIQFQKASGLTADGIVGEKTWAALTGNLSDAEWLPIAERYELTPANYCTTASYKKTGVCLHHTAGGPDAKRVVDVWNKDNRGRVATHFVIGRDGKIVQCMPLSAWGYHIAMGRMGFNDAHNEKINAAYIGIELCAWGYLEKKNGKFLSYTDTEVPISEVEFSPWREYDHWQTYTPQQVESCRQLLQALKKRFYFNYIESSIDNVIDFLELSWRAMRGQRTLTAHSNFEYGKFDPAPTDALWAMVKDFL